MNVIEKLRFGCVIWEEMEEGEEMDVEGEGMEDEDGEWLASVRGYAVIVFIFTVDCCSFIQELMQLYSCKIALFCYQWVKSY